MVNYEIRTWLKEILLNPFCFQKVEQLSLDNFSTVEYGYRTANIQISRSKVDDAEERLDTYNWLCIIEIEFVDDRIVVINELLSVSNFIATFNKVNFDKIQSDVNKRVYFDSYLVPKSILEVYCEEEKLKSDTPYLHVGIDMTTTLPLIVNHNKIKFEKLGTSFKEFLQDKTFIKNLTIKRVLTTANYESGNSWSAYRNSYFSLYYSGIRISDEYIESLFSESHSWSSSGRDASSTISDRRDVDFYDDVSETLLFYERYSLEKHCDFLRAERGVSHLTKSSLIPNQ